MRASAQEEIKMSTRENKPHVEYDEAFGTFTVTFDRGGLQQEWGAGGESKPAPPSPQARVEVNDTAVRLLWHIQPPADRLAEYVQKAQQAVKEHLNKKSSNA